jgi:hypothetical protein
MFRKHTFVVVVELDSWFWYHSRLVAQSAEQGGCLLRSASIVRAFKDADMHITISHMNYSGKSLSHCALLIDDTIEWFVKRVAADPPVLWRNRLHTVNLPQRQRIGRTPTPLALVETHWAGLLHVTYKYDEPMTNSA